MEARTPPQRAAFVVDAILSAVFPAGAVATLAVALSAIAISSVALVALALAAATLAPRRGQQPRQPA